MILWLFHFFEHLNIISIYIYIYIYMIQLFEHEIELCYNIYIYIFRYPFFGFNLLCSPSFVTVWHLQFQTNPNIVTTMLLLSNLHILDKGQQQVPNSLHWSQIKRTCGIVFFTFIFFFHFFFQHHIHKHIFNTLIVSHFSSI